MSAAQSPTAEAAQCTNVTATVGGIAIDSTESLDTPTCGSSLKVVSSSTAGTSRSSSWVLGAAAVQTEAAEPATSTAGGTAAAVHVMLLLVSTEVQEPGPADMTEASYKTSCSEGYFGDQQASTNPVTARGL